MVSDLAGQLASPFQGRFSGHRVIGGVSVERRHALEALCALAARGEYRVVIDRVYPFAEIEQALTQVDGGHKRGNIVVRL